MVLICILYKSDVVKTAENKKHSKLEILIIFNVDHDWLSD